MDADTKTHFASGQVAVKQVVTFALQPEQKSRHHNWNCSSEKAE